MAGESKPGPATRSPFVMAMLAGWVLALGLLFTGGSLGWWQLLEHDQPSPGYFARLFWGCLMAGLLVPFVRGSVLDRFGVSNVIVPFGLAMAALLDLCRPGAIFLLHCWLSAISGFFIGVASAWAVVAWRLRGQVARR